MVDVTDQAEKKILLVDDEKEILDLLKTVLRKEGFSQVEKVQTGKKGIERCRDWQPDAIVLDIMLPDMDGFEVCRQMRTFTIAPILFLSARSDDLDKLLGLGIGGDDYVTKPFSPKEVAFRLKAQFRRSGYLEQKAQNELKKGQAEELPPNPPVYHFGDVRVDTACGEVTRLGDQVTLTAREYGLLLYLLENPNRILSKEKICEAVWGEPYIGLDNTIMVHIHNLREKIEIDPGSPHYILTVKGLGYKFSNRG